MALRLIEIRINKNEKEKVDSLLKEYEASILWNEDVSGEMMLVKVVLPAEECEQLSDTLEKQYGDNDQFRMILIPVEAALPRQKEEAHNTELEKEVKAKKAYRISREELYHDIDDANKLNMVYISMVVLSAIVGSIGILRNNLIALLGAMLIAPLLGPNVALSLAATLGDLKLGFKALKVNLAGLIAALLVAVVIGFIFRGYSMTHSDVFNVQVRLDDVAIALSAGAAGALAFTTGMPATLIGVMVAAALVPPLVSLGLFAGAGLWAMAYEAFLLLASNVICINLAGVIVFYIQGVRPLTWWEKDQARKAMRIAMIIWIGLLAVLVLLIYLLQK